MIEMKVESIRVSLMTQHRVVILKELNAERYLPIWIGPFEADAIALELQEVRVARPLTHDLLRSVIYELGATVTHVLVNELRDDTNEKLRVVVSTTTTTGQKLAQERFGADNVFYFPLDFGFCIRPYMRALRPKGMRSASRKR